MIVARIAPVHESEQGFELAGRRAPRCLEFVAEVGEERGREAFVLNTREERSRSRERADRRIRRCQDGPNARANREGEYALGNQRECERNWAGLRRQPQTNPTKREAAEAECGVKDRLRESGRGRCGPRGKRFALRRRTRLVAGDRHFKPHLETCAELFNRDLTCADDVGCGAFAEPLGESVTPLGRSRRGEKLEERARPENVEILRVGMSRVAVAVAGIATICPSIRQSCDPVLVESPNASRSCLLAQHAIVKDDEYGEGDHRDKNEEPVDRVGSKGEPADEHNGDETSESRIGRASRSSLPTGFVLCGGCEPVRVDRATGTRRVCHVGRFRWMCCWGIGCQGWFTHRVTHEGSLTSSFRRFLMTLLTNTRGSARHYEAFLLPGCHA